MIDLVNAKRVLAVVLFVTGGAVGLLGLRAVAESVLRAASGADPAAVFNETPPAPAEVMEALDWLPDPTRDGRAIEPATRLGVTDAYARALAALDRAGRGDPSAPLPDYFSGPALDAARAAARSADRGTTATIHLRHELRLDFYSDDGSIVAVGVPSVEVVRVIGDDDDRTVLASDEAWRFVMLLEDGNWRIQQLEVVAVDVADAPGSLRSLDRGLDGVNVVTASGSDPTWRSFDAAAAIGDLDAARGLGWDAVRVFVPGPELEPVDVGAFSTFLDLAAERDIGVVPVLFDGSADHHPTGWRDDREYLERVVGSVAGHPAIVMWDVKNEPDLDDERSGGAAYVDAWLRRTVEDVKAIDAEIPVTIGWSRADVATRLVDAVDVVSFHHFGDAPTLAAAIDRLDREIGDRPLIVSELGRPAWVGPVRGAMPAAQARAVADLLDAVGGADGSMLWVLRDPAGPVEDGFVAGRASTTYGVLRHDRTERPVAEVVRSAGSAVPEATFRETFRGEIPTIGSVLALVGVVAVGSVITRRRRGERLIEH